MKDLSKITWVKKEDFKPIENKWYWVIIPKENSESGFYVPYSAKYKDGFYITEDENELFELDNEVISHIAEIIYPQN
jgi:hypothetical protein